MLVDQNYALPFTELNPMFIIDAGANIGLAAVYFANVYPKAKIYAIEPEQSNYELLLQNIQQYSNIQAFKAALWNNATRLEISNCEAKKWAFQVKELRNGSIIGVTVDDLLEKSGHDQIDILKIDIEGGEKEIFSFGYDKWLGKVGLIILELHDSFRIGCRETFEKAISQYSFIETSRGEHVILRKRA